MKKRKKSKVKQTSGEEEASCSSDDEDYNSQPESGKATVTGKNLRIRFISEALSSVQVEVSAVTSNTPRIPGRGLASKRARKGRKIIILPDSGATMTLCHARVARRLELNVSRKDANLHELYDAQQKRM